jgi:hypothetical protein
MKIVVTDLTRFSNRDIVCLAGINVQTGHCVRPLTSTAPGYLAFADVKKHRILPGSVLEAKLVPAEKPTPPHVEDHYVVGNIKVAPQISGDDFRSILENSSVASLQQGFGMNPADRCYEENAPLNCSIITLKVDPVNFSIRRDTFNENKFKAFFTDADGLDLSFVPVTDLGFSDHIQTIATTDPHFGQLNAFINSQGELYLRVGLSRPYTGGGRRGCWVQLNGIYTFPDYRTDIRQYDY